MVINDALDLADVTAAQSLLFGASSRGFQSTFGEDDSTVNDESPGVEKANHSNISLPSTPPRSPSSHDFEPISYYSDQSWELQSEPSGPKELPSPSPIHTSKCLYSHQVVNSPPVSPSKKNAKRVASSSTHMALEMATDGQEPRGLLRFYKPTTWEVEYETNVVTRIEKWEQENEATRREEENLAMRKAVRERENARLRKQKERALKKDQEIQLGIRNANGTKRKVGSSEGCNTLLTSD